MTSRSDRDTPAAVIAALAGIAVLLVAVPLTLQAFPQTPKSYDALWGQRGAGSVVLTVPTETGTYTATVSGSDIQPAAIIVETPSTACRDIHTPQLQQSPATLQLKLVETRDGATRVLKQTAPFPCSAADTEGTFEIPLGDHADIASVQAQDLETAQRIVWLDAAGLNTTVSYTLEVTANRPASSFPPLPGNPVTATSLTAVINVSLQAWHVALNEHQPEVGR